MVRASTQAKGSPSDNESAVAPNEHTSDSLSACAATGVRRSCPRLVHETSLSRPSKGSAKNATASTATATTNQGGRTRRLGWLVTGRPQSGARKPASRNAARPSGPRTNAIQARASAPCVDPDSAAMR